MSKCLSPSAAFYACIFVITYVLVDVVASTQISV